MYNSYNHPVSSRMEPISGRRNVIVAMVRKRRLIKVVVAVTSEKTVGEGQNHIGVGDQYFCKASVTLINLKYKKN